MNNEIFKDFNTLNIFCKRYSYKIGYFIFYGYKLEQLKSFFNKKENSNELSKYENIIVICKKDKCTKTETSKLGDLINIR